MAAVLTTIRLIAADQLAAVIKNRVDKVLIIDSRSFLEFNTCHVLNSVNVCCSKIVKRRLQQDKVSVKEFLAHTCQIDADESFDIIVYDQGSLDVLSVPFDSFIHVLLGKLVDVFKSVSLLRGGFLEFQASHPCLCENKTRLCAPLTSLSQPCLPISNIGPTRILPFLYLGSQNDALNKELLQDHNITYELNVSTSCPQPDFIQEGHFMRIAVNDNYCAKLLPHFPQAFQFLDKVQEANGCVLVHCLAGISRSPTVAIAYIMRHLHLTSDEAYRYVKSKRATISPNFNFLGQLLEFERQLQAENTLKCKDMAVTAPVFSNGSKRQCCTDMRSSGKLALSLNLPVAMDASCKEFASSVLRPRPGDQSPTTGIAKLSFHTVGELEPPGVEPVGVSPPAPPPPPPVHGLCKAADGQEKRLCQSRYSSSKGLVSSMMAMKGEARHSTTSMSSSSASFSEKSSSSFIFSKETKRFVTTSKVQIHQSVGQPGHANLPRSAAAPRCTLSTLNIGLCHVASNSSQESTPEREVSTAPAPVPPSSSSSIERSRDSLTDSVDSLTRSSSSVCSSWAADIPEYCRSDSTSTSGLGSEVSDLDSLVDVQSVGGGGGLPSPKREIIIDNEGVVLRKPCFLLPGPAAVSQLSGGDKARDKHKLRDSGNPISPSEKICSFEDDDDKSKQMFGFWEKASTTGNVEASHDSGIVTSPSWMAADSGEELAPKWLSCDSEVTKKMECSKMSTATGMSVTHTSTWPPEEPHCSGSMTKHATGVVKKFSASARVSRTSEVSKTCEVDTESKTVSTTEAWRSLVAKHFLGTVFTGRDPAGGTLSTQADGLYRAHSCPGIMSWLQCASSSPDPGRGPTISPSSPLFASSDPRFHKLNLSSIGRAERFRNRYSCGSLDGADLERLIFDSCPDFGHFGRCHSSSKSLEGGEIAPLSPTHRVFGRNARVIQVS